MIQFFERIIGEKDYLSCFKDTGWVCILSTNQQLNHPVAHDWLPTEGLSLVRTWMGDFLGKLLEEVLVRPAEGAQPVVCVGPNVQA